MEGNVRRAVRMVVLLDGRRVASETVCASAGAHVFTVVTTLPGVGLAIEHSSAFVGHHAVALRAIHLTLGPPGHEPVMATVTHEHDLSDPASAARPCVYEHVQVLLERLHALGYDAAIEVPDGAFADLERTPS